MLYPAQNQSLEQWKDIAGYEGLYKVSSFGRIAGKKIRKIHLANMGYFVVDLYKNNRRETLLVHRLIARAFVSGWKEGLDVNHKDGNKENNKIENLEWCTRSENIQHAFDVLGYRNNFQTNNPKSSLGKFGRLHHVSKPVLQLLYGKIIKRWDCGMDAVRANFGFRSSHISECCEGKRKSHGGYEWKFA